MAEAFSITACTADRQRFFASAENVDDALGALRDALSKFEMHVLAYCFMPDHVHLLFEGKNETNMMDFVKLFKQLAGFRLKKRTGRSLWQKSYYDRIVRLEEDLADFSAYIFANPVRKGIVTGAVGIPVFRRRVFRADVGRLSGRRVGLRAALRAT